MQCRRGQQRTVLTRWAAFFVLASASVGLVAQTVQQAVVTATSRIRAHQYDQAIEEAEAALQKSPSDPRLLTVDGIARSMKGDDTGALQRFRAAVKSSPGYLGALKGEAEILARKQDTELVPVLREILRVDPGDPTAREMLAVAEAKAGHCADALPEFAGVLSRIQSHPVSLQTYGACLYQQKRYSEAASAFQQGLASRPDDQDTRYDLALAQLLSNQSANAAQTVQPLLDHAPDVDILALASDIYERTGDTPRAANLMREAIIADPHRANSYVRFAELCMAHESYQVGVDMVSAGIVRLPTQSSLFLARGMLFGGMAEYDRAESDFRQAELLDPLRGTGAYGVGLIQAQRNNPEDALMTTRTALRSHPEDAQLHLLLARVLIEQGAASNTPAFAEATASAEKAVRLNPDLVAARDLLAKIYMKVGRNAAAVEQCRAALELEPTDQNALYRLMRLTRESGDAAAAKSMTKQVADLFQRAREQEAERLRYRIERAPEKAGEAFTPAVRP